VRLFAHLCLLLLISCGESPLLNHKMLGDLPSRALNPQTAQRFNRFDMDFEMAWSDGCPNSTDNCSFELTLSKAMPAGSTLVAKPWMPSMGHGSGELPTVSEVGPQTWSVQEVYFIMPGIWQLFLTMKLSDGSTDEIILDYHIH